jgi:hypothetical protein
MSRLLSEFSKWLPLPKCEKIEKHKNDHSRLLAKQKLMKRDRNNINILVERDRPNKSESVGQTLLQLSWKQKRGDLKKCGFLSSNFMKLCRNIHRSVWQLLGVEKNSKWWPLPW